MKQKRRTEEIREKTEDKIQDKTQARTQGKIRDKIQDRTQDKIPWGHVILGGVLLAAAGILQAAARNCSGFGQWYAVTVYPWIVGKYGRLCGIFPFSVVELGLYFTFIGGILYIVSHFRQWKRVTAKVFLFLSALAFFYTANCGINYYRRPFSSYLDLEVRESSVEELTELCVYLVEKVNETVPEEGETFGQMQRSGQREPGGQVELSGQAEPDRQVGLAGQMELASQGQKAMERLGETYPQLSGYYPRPKPVLVSWILAVQQLCGIYSPFTVEANYNWRMTGYNIPHTLCHELSHLKGFMREDEANFIGYLACIGAEEPFFQYSGYLMGWVYAGNALAAQDMDTYIRLHNQLPARAVEDLLENNAYWDQYEGKVAEAANQMNDTYLKMNDQEDGVKSYGRVVDLMLAYYRDE